MPLAPRKPALFRSSPWRHFGEVAVGVLILSLAVRTWLLEGLIVPVTVSGGSMAENLRGPHRQFACENCGYTFANGTDPGSAGGPAVCPNCGQTGDESSGVERPGHRVLVDRTAFLARGPQRWDLVVFRCPDRPDEFCVKRVAGLPGESVQIREGDVYINGRIARKNLIRQRATAHLVYDDSYMSRRPADAPRWRGEAASRWTGRQGRYGYPARPAAPADGPIDWLVYHHLGERPVRDGYSYNQGETRRLNDVSDVKLSCRLKTTGAGDLFLQAVALSDRFELQIAVDTGRIVLRHNGGSVANVPGGTPVLERNSLFELSLFDRQLMLAVDSRVQLVYPFDPTVGPDSPTARPLAIGSRGLEIEVAELKIWRDIYYTDPPVGRFRWGLERPCQLGPDELYVLGDNSPISLDSRTLRQGPVACKFLVGKPLQID